jgi:thioredoxin 1
MVDSINGEQEFSQSVLESGLPVLVDFWATWCAPCLAVAPILEELSKEYEDRVKFTRVNVEDNGGLAARYGIAAIPTMILFKNGEAVRQIVGLRSKKDLKKELDSVCEG